MGKALKIMVVVILLLSVATLFLAYLNYQKRDVLVGRNNIAVPAIVRLAGTLEKDDPVFDGVMDVRGRDMDDVTARVIENPTESRFWDNYEKTMRKFEETGGAMMNVQTRLSTSSAPDAMGAVIKDIQERALAQMTTLNNTRKALTAVREELADTIKELNALKKEGRKILANEEALKDKLATAEAKQKDAEAKANRALDNERDLKDLVKEKEQDIAAEKERFVALEKEKILLAKQLDEAKDELSRRGVRPPVDDGASRPQGVATMSAGVKGTVVSVDAQYGFVVVRLSDAAMEELAGPAESRTGKIPEADVMVRRHGLKGPAGDFVTSLRLRAVRNDGTNLVMADNLPAWEQVPAAVGDEVFYQ